MVFSTNLEEHLEVVEAELVGARPLGSSQDVIGKVQFLLLQLKYSLLHGAFHHKPNNKRRLKDTFYLGN